MAGAIALITVLGFLQTFRPDEFLHLHNIWLVSCGQLPYRDFFEHHACGYYYLMMPACRLFSPSTSISSAAGFLFFSRAVTLVFGTLSLALMLAIGYILEGRRVATLSIIFLSGMPFFLSTSVECRPDVVALTLWLAGFAIIIREVASKNFLRLKNTALCLPDKKLASLSLNNFCKAGFCLGASVMLTQKMLFVLPGFAFTGLLWVCICRSTERRGRLAAVGLFSLGLILPILGFWLYFVTNDAGSVFINNVFLINSKWKYHQSAIPLLQQFWDDSWLISILGLAGAISGWVSTIKLKQLNWASILLQAVILGWLVGLLTILPIADVQFFLIPLPLLAILASIGLTSLSHIIPKQIHFLFFVLVVVVATVPPIVTQFNTVKARRFLAWQPFYQASLVSELTQTNETVLDGWTGMGVFRPQAWYYGFVHNEIPPMITEQEKERLMTSLESGKIRPAIIADDENLFGLHPRLREWVKSHYLYDSKLRAYIYNNANK